MYSIKEKVNSLTEINKSKFYVELIPLNSIDNIPSILENVKERYKDATHYCYAYIYDQVKRFNDDGEPGGTAGMPILNVLESNNLNHMIAIVIRYFGGIKLGAGGLVRAYSNSVSESLNKANIIELIKGKRISIDFSYDNVKQVDYLLKDYEIVNKVYNDIITYEVNIPNDVDLENILSKNIIKFTKIEDILITK